MKCPVFWLLSACEKLSETFRTFVRTSSVSLGQAALGSARGRFKKAGSYGEADEDHDRNRFFVDPAKPEFETRMVSAMRSRRGDDRAGKRRSHLEPGPACIGGMAQLGQSPSVAGSRWLGTDLPEFTTGSRAEHKNQLTAAVEIHKIRRRYEIQIAAYYFIFGIAGSSGNAGSGCRAGRATT